MRDQLTEWLIFLIGWCTVVCRYKQGRGYNSLCLRLQRGKMPEIDDDYNN